MPGSSVDTLYGDQRNHHPSLFRRIFSMPPPAAFHASGEICLPERAPVDWPAIHGSRQRCRSIGFCQSFVRNPPDQDPSPWLFREWLRFFVFLEPECGSGPPGLRFRFASQRLPPDPSGWLCVFGTPHIPFRSPFFNLRCAPSRFKGSSGRPALARIRECAALPVRSGSGHVRSVHPNGGRLSPRRSDPRALPVRRDTCI